MGKIKKSVKKISSGPILKMEDVVGKIFMYRGQKVMIDSDLAELYEIPTKRLVEQVKRNIARFPDDFMSQLTKEEAEVLKSQNAASKAGRGGRRYLPYTFTEQGVAMLSSVLKSPRAVQVNIAIMRAFVKMREIASDQKAILRKIEALERASIAHDEKIKLVFGAIRELTTVSKKPGRQIGFKASAKKK